jgi:O-antigen/teichoic acid export membrane protein
MKSSSSLRKDAATNLSSNLLLALLGVGSGSLISYRFGASARGIVSIAQVVFSVSAGLGALGLGDSFLHFSARFRGPDRRQVIVGSVFGACVAASLGLVVGLLVTSFSKAAGQTPHFTLFCTCSATVTTMLIIPGGALRGGGRYFHWNLVRVLAATIWVIALAIVGGSNGGVPQFGWLTVIYCAPLGLLAVWQMSTLPSSPVADGERLRPDWSALLAFGIPSSFAALPLLLNARLDQVALGIDSSAKVVGLYAAAAGYCWATVPFGQAIATLTASRVAAQAKLVDQTRVLKQLAGLGSLFILISGAAAWIAAPWALRLLNGAGFGGSVSPARILLAGATLQGMTYLLEEGARGLGQPRLPMVAEILGLLTMTVGLVIFARRGSTPTAIASDVGYFASFGWMCVGIGRITGERPWAILRPKLDVKAVFA